MYNYLIESMTWSHSRIGSYLQCPYQFYMKYISGMDGAPMFFASFGSLVHSLLAGYYSGNLSASQAETEYLIRFPKEATGVVPSSDIRQSYFRQGWQAIKALSPIPGKVLDVEQFVRFEIGGRPFVGFVDLVYRDDDGALVIMDHKSATLKPRSKRKKPTQTDRQLDEYLRQLYLYAIPIQAKYGSYPDFLEFNCYRSGEHIKEQFQKHICDATKDWAAQTIDQIGSEKDWRPNVDWWRCKYICGYYDQCEYAQLFNH